ncbi:probable L-cysteine desulfhydrase, chloroplastic isoform X2 [Medicago truncatula]|uniref:Isopenicillin N epimerase-like protein n=1 Tax=Medicago truncatula TaxID=3880 RepID=A0A072VMQ4_MEDTR|nr:probable L-cysteine desulfhydrase, chloroplastic isoform X2 [Medicago truncatula]KEH43127.1 isopenicillin N epimerase-like protein [Medicago truncatula]
MAFHDQNNNHTNGEVSKKPKLSFSAITDTEIQSEFSHHDPTVARLNNGAFGCCPSSVLAAQRQWQLKSLRQPDHFYFNHLQKGILHSRTIIKDLVNAQHVNEISIVDNASTATAIVLQQASWAFQEGKFNKGDSVVMLHYAYGSVKKAIEAYVTRAGGRVIEVPLTFPVTSEDDIIREFRHVLEKTKSEAHAVGCTPRVDMQEIGADFYTSNLHKWFFCPPSVAFIYTRKSVNSVDLHHPVVSHEYGNGLAIESSWIGNRDYSAQLVVPTVMEFVNRFEGGIEGIKERNHDCVVEMGEMLVEAWGTHLGTPHHMSASMVMVGLPPSLGIMNECDAMNLRTHLREFFGVEVPIYFRDGGEVGCVSGYARISYQVYNKVDDYYKFRDAINQLVSDGLTCAFLSS